ncbi:hypothetical protein [Pyxidicoccus trucidator]|uniref:hypothetical protein n=1 Tax=Pyxidicoccus trucidator TaxID=2709662 RepID=UPI0013DBB8E2|nr:hypothetical protein [Pyxidicoccus trucidator]
MMSVPRFHGIATVACALGVATSALAISPNTRGAEAEPLDRAGVAARKPYKHEALLASPAETDLSESTSPELQAELRRLPAAYDMDRLPVIYDKSGKLRVVEHTAAPKGNPELNLSSSNRVSFRVGFDDLNTYHCWNFTLPSYMTDVDGGTIRLIMQHEIDGLDQVRVIDEHIGTEYHNNDYGNRGRFHGRYGWTRQSGGGEWSWILGDGSPSNLAAAWDWAWIVDYGFPFHTGVLGGDNIRICSHPHVTTRVSLMD